MRCIVFGAQALGVQPAPRSGSGPSPPRLPGTVLWSPGRRCSDSYPFRSPAAFPRPARGVTQVCGCAGEPGQGREPLAQGEGGCPKCPAPPRSTGSSHSWLQPLLLPWSPCPAGRSAHVGELHTTWVRATAGPGCAGSGGVPFCPEQLAAFGRECWAELRPTACVVCVCPWP